MSPYAASLLANRTARDLVAAPFPHLVASPALPAAAYDELARHFPSPDAILHGRSSDRNNSAARLPYFLADGNAAVDPRWQAFFAYHVSQRFWLDIVGVFGAMIRERYPALEGKVGRRLEDWRVVPRGETARIGRDADLELDCQFVVNTPVRELSAVRTLHLDGQDTLFSGLFYMREPADTVGGGELQLGRWRRAPRVLESRMIIPRDVEVVKTVPYAANLFTCFVNGPGSVHAVTPRGVTPLFRRYVNLIAKVGFDLFELAPVGKVARYLNARALKTVRESYLKGDRHRQAVPRGEPSPDRADGAA
jgi:hypothetical protein